MTELADIEFAPHLPDIKPKLTKNFYRITPDWFYEFEYYHILSPTAKTVYSVLQQYVSVKGYIGKLSNKTLAQKAQVSRKHIYEYVKELTDLGLVYNFKNGWVRYYQLVLDKPPYINQQYIDKIKARKQRQKHGKQDKIYKDVMLEARC